MEPACLLHADPRGGIFQVYQNDFDRCHPFGSLDAFCTEHDAPDEELQATDDGITKDSIALVHIRSKLEQLEASGFATDIGDPARMFDTFAWYVNNICGGVHGRMIDLKLVEVDTFGSDISALRNEACISATEDRNAVIVLNTTGFQGSATLCIVEQHETAFISTQGQPAEYVERSGGRLVSMSPTLEESLSFLAGYLLDSGEVEGETVGVVYSDTPGHPDVVWRNLIYPLEAAGIDVAVKDRIGCGYFGCAEGVSESVSRMLDANVDVILPTLNVISLPGYLGEMAKQGFKPGDVQFYNSDFNSQASNLVASKILAFGGADAAELYNGAIIVDDADPAAFHDPNWEPTPFNQMCDDVYNAYHYEVAGNAELSQPPHDPIDTDGNSVHAMIATVCAQLRIALRAIYDAGPNPTREDIYEAMSNLGVIDFNNMIPSSLKPGKPQTTDVVHTLQFSYPCANGAEFAMILANQAAGTCLVNAYNDQWLTVAR